MNVPFPVVCLATNNAHKLGELRDVFAAALPGVRFVALDEAGGPHPDAPEHGATFADNAIAKARWYAARTGLPTIADDSGLCVDGLGGAPGIHSARYAPNERERIARVLRELVVAEAEAVTMSEVTGASPPLRVAHFACVMALVDPAAPGGAEAAEPLVAEGRVDGSILAAPRGDGGFGYDPIFLVPELGRSMAELTPAEKHAVSHRGRAAAALAAKMGAAVTR